MEFPSVGAFPWRMHDFLEDGFCQKQIIEINTEETD